MGNFIYYFYDYKNNNILFCTGFVICWKFGSWTLNKDCRIWIEMQENWKFIQILLCWIYFVPFLEFSFKILLFDKSLNINWVPLFYVHLSHYLCILIEFMLFGFFVLPNGWVGYGRHLVMIFMQKRAPILKA